MLWVVAIIQKKWTVSCACGYPIIVRKGSYQKEVYPVILEMFAVHPEVLF